MSPTSPTLAIVNARVWTGDPRRPWADAVLVCGGSIEAVGSSAEVKKRCTDATVVIDAGTMLVTARPAIPGALQRGAPANLVVARAEGSRVTAEPRRDAELVLEVRDGLVVFDRDGLARRPPKQVPSPADHTQ